MIRCLPDVNYWLALSLQAHPHHAKVSEHFESDPASRLHFCRSTQQGLLRLLTTAAVTNLVGRPPLSNHSAIKSMDALLGHDRIHFATEPERLYERWKGFADVGTASPKLWVDAYLAAFAAADGFQLVTMD